MAKNKKPSAASSSPVRGVDLSEIEKLLDFMRKHGLEEFEYEREGFRIRLKKPSAAPASYAQAPPPEIVVAAPAPHAAHAPSAAPPREPAADAGRSEDLHIVKSPIVGTFYVAAGPDADPFVKVGSKVDVGQVLCIIEAMKLMNEIESDAAGEIVRVFVENGQPVEYGEALFGIRPHRKK
ncbi:MAG: acetyl-CoA carboxylase biotin carboxyl carrier protein [Candidatus Acidiferrales bacterium]